ncbi:MAG: aminotransferase class I/II-fold pyridoxal phosphate-dependent enzyme [Clostridia bacterium]|nr:aminotransferase class I/II-fold pyridoxal phosphate-dependent enzyme [Clostridia bacterium]
MKEKFVAKRAEAGEPTIFANSQNLMAGMTDVIDLSIGDPDFTTPAPILEAAYKDSLAGHTHYTAYRGDADAIQAVVDYYKRELDVTISEKNVHLLASADYAAFITCFATIEPGDEVLIPNPSFTCYADQVVYCGGTPVMVPTCEENNWRISAADMEKLITPKTRALFINSPCNPTGAILTKEDLQEIADLAVKYDLLVISDEIYTWYDYAAPFVSMLSIPGMAERTVVINSLSKNYVATGARMGWIVAPEQIVGAVFRLGLNMVYTAPAFGQRMTKFALNEGKKYMEPILADFKERMFKTAERINRIPHLHVQYPPQGTFYLFVNIKETGLTSDEFVLTVLEKAHVMLVPGQNFGSCGEGYVRICCTVGLPKLMEAMDRIEAIGL